MRVTSWLFALVLSASLLGTAAPASAQVFVNARFGPPRGYYHPRPYYGPRYYPPVAPLVMVAPPPPPVVIVPAPYYAPRPYFYGPRRGGWHGGRRW